MTTRRASTRTLIAAALVAAGAILAAPTTHAVAPPGLPRAPGRPPAGPPGDLSAADVVNVRLAADVARVEPGATFHLAVVFRMAPHWHIYWSNPGDAGLPTSVAVRGPEGYTTGRTLYPRPRAFEEPDGRTFGYDEEVVLFVPVTAPARPVADAPEFEVDVTYLACRERCLLGQAKRFLRLDGRDGGGDAARADLRARRDRLPRPLDALPGAEARLERTAAGDRLVVTGPAGDHRTAGFLPFDAPGVTFGAATALVEAGRFEVSVPFEARPQNALGRPMSAGGLVTLGPRGDDPSYAVALPVAAGPGGAP